MKLLVLLFFAIMFQFVYSLPIAKQKRQVSAKAWINGKEVDMSQGGTYRDKDGTFVSVNTNGNGVSMVSSSGNGGGCSIVGDVVHECNGKTRPLNNQDRQMLASYQEKMSNFMRSMFPPGFPFGSQIGQPKAPLFPEICKSCVAASIN